MPSDNIHTYSSPILLPSHPLTYPPIPPALLPSIPIGHMCPGWGGQLPEICPPGFVCNALGLSYPTVLCPAGSICSFLLFVIHHGCLFMCHVLYTYEANLYPYTPC